MFAFEDGPAGKPCTRVSAQLRLKPDNSSGNGAANIALRFLG
jgi:hypothetical protein